MAPEPRYRQLLSQLLEAVQEDSLEVTRGEIQERRNLRSNRAHASVVEARIRHVKRDLDLLKTAAERLREQQAVLERLKACAHNAAQPVYRIPDEILSDIFEYGTSGAFDLWELDPPTSRLARWSSVQYAKQRESIGASCSHFRTTIINAPRCWSFITCVIHCDKQRSTSLLALKARLTRSNNCRFVLLLEIGSVGEELPSSYDLEAVSRLLLPHMPRCRSLRLVSDQYCAKFPLLVPDSPFRGLQHVTFDWRDAVDFHPELENHSTRNAEDAMLSLLVNTKSPLQSLAVMGLYNSPGNFGRIDVRALTHLKIDADMTGKVFQFLQRCTKLKHLDWVVHDTDEILETYPDHVELCDLISLRVSGNYIPGKPCILNAPGLKQVQFESDLSKADLPFDIVQPDHPVLPGLSRVKLTHCYSPGIPSFLRRYRHITECVIYAENLRNSQDAIGIRAVLDSLLPYDQKKRVHSMRHLSLWFGTLDAAIWDEVEPTMELVLDELPQLHVDLHTNSWAGGRPGSFCERFGTRISVTPPIFLDSTWPDAWGTYDWFES